MAYGFNPDRSKAPVYTKSEVDAMDLVNDRALAQEILDRQAAVQQEASDRAAAVSVVDARIDTILSNPLTEEEAIEEVADIRVGYDGTEYASAGSAVRKQVEKEADTVSTLADCIGSTLGIGKNLFNPLSLVDIMYAGYHMYSVTDDIVTVLYSDGTPNENAGISSNYMIELPVGKYTLSVQNACRLQVTVNGEKIYDSYSNVTSTTFTLTEDINYCYFKFIHSSYPSVIGHVMVERSSTATAYEPYKKIYYGKCEPLVVVNYLKGQFVDGVLDSQTVFKSAAYDVSSCSKVFISGLVGAYQDKYDFTATDETDIISYERNFSTSDLTLDNYEVDVPQGAKLMYITSTNITRVKSFEVKGIVDRFTKIEKSAVPKYAVFVGDSYAAAGSLGYDICSRFSTLLCERLKVNEINYAVGGMGYVTGDTKFIDQLQNAIADVSYSHDEVGYVFICGCRNDDGSLLSPMLPDNTFVTAVQEVIRTAIEAYANAEVIVIPSLQVHYLQSNAGQRVYSNIIYAARSLNCRVIPNAYSWLVGMKDYTLPDGVHPTVEGHAIIASHILDALTTGNTFAYPDRIQLNANTDYMESGVCNLLQENNVVLPYIRFLTTAQVPAGSTLFSYETSSTQNMPCYCATRNILAYNSGAGTALLLVLQMEYTDDGYVVTVKNQAAINANQSIVVIDQHIAFGLQPYAGS